MGAPTRKVFLYLHKLLDAPYLSDEINRKIKRDYIISNNNSSILGFNIDEIKETKYGYYVENLKVNAGHSDYFKDKYIDKVSDFFAKHILD